MADLSGADLQKTNLAGARLFKANLTGANLAGANLEGAELTAADLSLANLEMARVTKAGLGMAVLRGARLFQADLTHSTLTKADLSGADMRCVCLERARMREAVLNRVDLTSADLRSVDFSGSEVRKAVFADADMRNANLNGLIGYESASWVGVDMRGINFSGAYLLRRFAMDQNYIKEFRQSSRVASYIFYLWWISSDCGRSITRWLFMIAIFVLVFAGFYDIVEVDYGRHNPSWFQPIYFSLVTMTTLGYGDVIPVSTGAQMIAMLQVLLGYIMLGGLLSIFSNKLARRAE
jgi:uncharacterized protein YjbI with pentapeptide repeats